MTATPRKPRKRRPRQEPRPRNPAEQAARAVPCPREGCPALVGERCESRNGTNRSTSHPERYTAAAAAAAGEPGAAYQRAAGYGWEHFR